MKFQLDRDICRRLARLPSAAAVACLTLLSGEAGADMLHDPDLLELERVLQQAGDQPQEIATPRFVVSPKTPSG